LPTAVSGIGTAVAVAVAEAAVDAEADGLPDDEARAVGLAPEPPQPARVAEISPRARIACTFGRRDDDLDRRTNTEHLRYEILRAPRHRDRHSR
jgi:hypothetical protein